MLEDAYLYSARGFIQGWLLPYLPDVSTYLFALCRSAHWKFIYLAGHNEEIEIEITPDGEVF